MGRPIINPKQDPIIVPNATSETDGLMSAVDKIKLDGFAPGSGNGNMVLRRDGAVVHFYIDGINGLDTNDGSQPTQGSGNAGPVKTIGRLYDLAPWVAFGSTVVLVDFVSDGATEVTYTIDNIYLNGGTTWDSNWAFRGPDMIRVTPTSGPSQAALDAATPTTVINVTNAKGVNIPGRCQLNFVTANPGWTVDDFAGCAFLRVRRGGARIFWELPISGNTANTLLIDEPGIANVLVAGDVCEIVKPAVRIRGIDRGGGWRSTTVYGFQSRHHWADIGSKYGANFQRIAFQDRVFVDGNAGASFDRCQATGDFPGTNAYLSFAVGGLPIVNCAFRYYGLYVYGSQYTPHIPTTSRPDSSNDDPVGTPYGVIFSSWNGYLYVGGFDGSNNANGASGAYLYLIGRIGLWGQAQVSFSSLCVKNPGSLFQMLRSYKACVMGGKLPGQAGPTFGMSVALGACALIDPDFYCLNGSGSVGVGTYSGDIVVGGTIGLSASGTTPGNLMNAATYNGYASARLAVNANGYPNGDPAWLSTIHY